MPSSRPRLEVLEYRPEIPSRAVDVVLLHGICVGAWVWTDAFIQPLLDAGYRVLAVSFRGHGASEGRSTRRQHRLSDFVVDAHHVIRNVRHHRWWSAILWAQRWFTGYCASRCQWLLAGY